MSCYLRDMGLNGPILCEKNMNKNGQTGPIRPTFEMDNKPLYISIK